METLSWKLENKVTTFYKTISKIKQKAVVYATFLRNIVYSNCLQTRFKFAFFFTLDDILFGKVTIICQFNENSFSKDFGTFKLDSASNVKVIQSNKNLIR